MSAAGQEREAVKKWSLCGRSGESERGKLRPERLKSGRGNHHELGNGVMGMFLLFNPACVSGCLARSDAEVGTGREMLPLQLCAWRREANADDSCPAALLAGAAKAKANPRWVHPNACDSGGTIGRSAGQSRADCRGGDCLLPQNNPSE